MTPLFVKHTFGNCALRVELQCAGDGVGREHVGGVDVQVGVVHVESREAEGALHRAHGARVSAR